MNTILSNFTATYRLTHDNVDFVLQAKMPGVYLLQEGNSVMARPTYVGRSDTDLADRLKDHIGKATYFRAAYCFTAEEAYQLELRIYNAYKPSRNILAPDAPSKRIFLFYYDKTYMVSSIFLRLVSSVFPAILFRLFCVRSHS